MVTARGKDVAVGVAVEGLAAGVGCPATQEVKVMTSRRKRGNTLHRLLEELPAFLSFNTLTFDSH